MTDDQRSTIAEIDTKTQRKIQWEYSEETEKMEPIPYEVEYIRIKLYDKQKALDSISKMLGFDAPTKIDATLIFLHFLI